MVYVDDLLVTCVKSSGVSWLLEQLKKRFKDITVCEGRKHSYLGQTFDFSEI